MKNQEYKKQYNEIAHNYCSLGATDKKLGRFFGVDENTIVRWKEKFPEFQGSIKRGRVIADATVAESTHRRACGYDVHEEKALVVNGEIQTVELRRHISGDVSQQRFWLTNRQPEKWALPGSIDNMTLKELYAEVDAMLIRIERIKEEST